MRLKLYQIDAFTEKPFTGNPAAVVPLNSWIPDHLLQSIALENNLSETAFYVKTDTEYEIRWFTPTQEVDLCGHATLASAYVIFKHLSPEDPVTGSAHSTLIPFWSDKLNKKDLTAYQCSARGGEIICKSAGDRIIISGKAIQYLEGEIDI